MTTLHNGEAGSGVKKRLFSEARKILIFIAIGIAYYIFVLINGKGFPCMFNVATGLLCPACGASRMVVCLSKLDFLSAFRYNRALFVTLPLLLVIFICYEARYIKTGVRKISGAEQKLLIAEIAVLVLFGIARNII